MRLAGPAMSYAVETWRGISDRRRPRVRCSSGAVLASETDARSTPLARPRTRSGGVHRLLGAQPRREHGPAGPRGPLTAEGGAGPHPRGEEADRAGSGAALARHRAEGRRGALARPRPVPV